MPPRILSTAVAVDDVSAAVAAQRVVATESDDHVGATEPGDDVGARCAEEHVGAGRCAGTVTGLPRHVAADATASPRASARPTRRAARRPAPDLGHDRLRVGCDAYIVGLLEIGDGYRPPSALTAGRGENSQRLLHPMSRRARRGRRDARPRLPRGRPATTAFEDGMSPRFWPLRRRAGALLAWPGDRGRCHVSAPTAMAPARKPIPPPRSNTCMTSPRDSAVVDPRPRRDAREPAWRGHVVLTPSARSPTPPRTTSSRLPADRPPSSVTVVPDRAQPDDPWPSRPSRRWVPGRRLRRESRRLVTTRHDFNVAVGRVAIVGRGGPATAAGSRAPPAWRSHRTATISSRTPATTGVRRVSTASSALSRSGSLCAPPPSRRRRRIRRQPPDRDAGNNRVRRVTQSGAISTVAGTGTAGDAGDGGSGPRHSFPTERRRRPSRRRLFIDTATPRRRVSPSGTVTRRRNGDPGRAATASRCRRRAVGPGPDPLTRTAS